MRDSLGSYSLHQVFLNYPFDPEFELFAYAIHFGVVAAGLLPVCAKDLSTPDRSRMDGIVEAFAKCRYSIHDLSRYDQPRHNNPFELGIAFSAMSEAKRQLHRCACFVPSGLDYQRVLSDLGGFDPRQYYDDLSLVVGIYEWLRDVVRDRVFSRQPISEIKKVYEEFKTKLKYLEGSGKCGQASHDEAQELMFMLCEERGWWDWRATKAGQIEFPRVPLSWRSEVPELLGR